MDEGRGASEVQRPIELFYSYAQEDEKLSREIEKHLTLLERQKQILPWHRRMLQAGMDYEQETDTHLNTAQIILLLISSDFLSSDYCYSTQMQRAIERHNAGSARVIPLLLRPVDWHKTPFSHLEPLPTNRKPITSWDNQDEALLNIAQGIRRVVEGFKLLPVGQRQQESKPVEPQQSPGQAPVINGLERPATVFLSYAREDTEEVRDLQLRLNVRGIRCWYDVDDLPVGSHSESEIVHAIEHEADAVAFFLTPANLKSDFIWRVEVPAALRRQKSDPHFHIVPVLQGVTFEEIKQFCHNRNITDLSSFNGIRLDANGAAGLTREEQNKKCNDAARRILQAAFELRLRRIGADKGYEPSLSLKTFRFTPRTDSLDLSLDWLKLVYEKERLPTLEEWDEILWPALLDVKHTISEKVRSHRIHLYVKSMFPVAIALGFVFRKTSGITLLLEGQNGTWSTEVSPSEEEPLRKEWTHHDQGNQQIAVVEVAPTRNIRMSVAKTLPLYGLTPGYHIRLEMLEISDTSVKDAAHARAMAQQVGRVCQKLCDEYDVTHLHLFVSTPVEMAVLIGYQLNALCPITLYGYQDNEKVYTMVGTLRK